MSEAAKSGPTDVTTSGPTEVATSGGPFSGESGSGGSCPMCESDYANPESTTELCLYNTMRFCGGLLAGGEKGRVTALKSLGQLDTSRENVFDNITKLLRSSFGTVGSHMVLIDPTRCWFKSWQGIWCDYETDTDHGKNVEALREDGWCNYIFVSTTAEMLVIEDATRDARVATNPFVVGPPYFRFYAGAPLVGSGGERYGTLCVVDLVPRCFSADKYALLTNFAALAVEEIEKNKDLKESLASHQFNSVTANRQLDLSLQASQEGMLMLDARDSSWPIMFSNPSFAAACGLSPEDLTEGRFWDLFTLRGKTQVELGLPTGMGDQVEMRVMCNRSQQELSMRLLPAISDRFAPSKATGLPAWAPYQDSVAGSLVNPSPNGSEGRIEGTDVVDEVKCFWFAIICASRTKSDLSALQGTKVDTEQGSDKDSTAASSQPQQWSRGASEASALSLTSSTRSAFCEYRAPAELKLQEIGPLLGSGSFGKVYRATVVSGGPAALKVVDCRQREDDQIQAQLREVQLSSKVIHPNVVKILGYATSADEAGGKPLDILWCVQELCELGTLTLATERGWLRQERSMLSPPDMAVVWRTLLDVSRAMAYVHGSNVVHSDLTGRNVLLGASQEDPRGFVAKVSDFGLARYVYGEGLATKVLGTITHMAPELLRTDNPTLTFESDVWAFGVVAWEAYNGKCAYKGKNAAQVVVAVVRKKALEWPAGAPEDFVSLMRECLRYDFSERSSFASVSASIERVL